MATQGFLGSLNGSSNFSNPRFYNDKLINKYSRECNSIGRVPDF